MNRTTPEQIREEQRQHAAAMLREEGEQSSRPQAASPRPILGTIRATKSSSSRKITPKGHEAFLKALESSGADVTFVIASSGALITGKVKHSDKYTVSVQVAGTTRVLFKHDISEFSAPAPERAASEA